MSNLRFLRVLADSRVVTQCTTFNQYELAATQLAREQLMRRFNDTEYSDTVVLAGFGRFGQSILEQLERHALVSSVAWPSSTWKLSSGRSSPTNRW